MVCSEGTRIQDQILINPPRSSTTKISDQSDLMVSSIPTEAFFE